MKRRAILISALALGLMLALAAGLSLAQEPRPQGGMGIQSANAGPTTSAPPVLGSVEGLGTGFTYQGRLNDGGSPANGSYDLQFKLYDAAGVGNQLGTVIKDDVTVTDGLFTLVLDFGVGAFTGDARWLEIGVRPGASVGAYTVLTPRQALMPAPYALALPGLWTQQNATSPNVIGGHSDNTVTSGVYGATIGGGGASSRSNIVTANHGTIGGGATNAASGLGSTVGGGNDNASSHTYATIGGGQSNSASERYATIGGGAHNTASGDSATISGGWDNEASDYAASIGGGAHNRAYGDRSTIGGGDSNYADADKAAIGGGESIRVTGRAGTVAGGSHITVTNQYAAVGGGQHNTASGDYATVGGGGYNTASGFGAVIAGGGGFDLSWSEVVSNTASGDWSTISGGRKNTASGWGAAVGGGNNNTANGTAAVVGGGGGNIASSWGATAGGGDFNTANGVYTTIGGGYGNTASGYAAAVGGGYLNHADALTVTIGGGEYVNVTGQAATVAGGSHITVTSECAAVGGGLHNTASGEGATIGGGGFNTASGEVATIGGGSFNTASGGATIGGGSGNVVTGTLATVGGGFWNVASGHYATIGGGEFNIASGYDAAVGGGNSNEASGDGATVGGGDSNTASSDRATVGGGSVNTASGYNATVGGGNWNEASGEGATVPGGLLNVAQGEYSFAVGQRAKANHNGAFVWADSTNADFASTAADQFAVRANGGALITGTSSAPMLTVTNLGNDDGLRVNQSGDDGLQIGDGINFPSYGVYIPSDGVPFTALYVQTADANGEWALSTLDKISAANVTFGSLTLVAVVDGPASLTPGDLVAASGLADPLPDTLSPLPRVRLADAKTWPGVIGVVESLMALQPMPGKADEDGSAPLELHSVPGPAKAGDYVALTVLGVAHVKADATAGAIVPGQRLTAADQSGHVRALRTRMLEGMVVTEGAPVIGIALAPLDEDTGTIPVFVTLR